jgi:signal transduction histidine kinase
MRAVRLVTWAAGAALCAALTVETIRGDLLSPAEASVHYAAVLISITVGLVVWERRPDSRTGMLLTAASFAYALSEMFDILPWSRLGESALVVTIAYAAIRLNVAILAHLFLSYPTGRLTTRLDRGFVALGYAVVIVYALPFLLFYDPRAPSDPDVFECVSCATPVTHVAWRDIGTARDILDGILLVLIVPFAVLLARKLIRASSAARRIVLPLVVAASFAAAQFAVQLGFWLTGSSVDTWTNSAMLWTETIGVLGVPLALGAGLLWGRSARAAVADLVVELEHTPPGSVRDALAQTLGDPSLRLALWLPERESYVDGEGRPLELPAPGPAQAITVLGAADAPVAALIHDPALLEQRAFLDAAGAAARFALENERLHAELRLQLGEVRASRARIVHAGDEERRRLERNLHDGAQQRLLGLGLALQLARAQLGPATDGTATLLAEAEEELRAALDELRELARGIHPAILTDQGLEAAVQSLAERSPVPVTIVGVPAERLGDAVEAAAYFLVSESLANVAKYAQASTVRVSITQRNGNAVVEIEDDGVGGADPAGGSGLRGLYDRVQALGGKLIVESPRGQGTLIRAEIPCG